MTGEEMYGVYRTALDGVDPVYAGPDTPWSELMPPVRNAWDAVASAAGA